MVSRFIKQKYIRIFEKAKKESGTEAKVEKLKKKVEEITAKLGRKLSDIMN